MDAYLKSFTSNAAKLSKKVQDNIAENTRDFRLENEAHFLETTEDKYREIRKNLDSRYEKEKLDGLKRLIAMTSKGRDVSEFFPDVVKNVASTSLEVRKLVYIYILRYAEQEQDLALLSINTFQKDLSDKNQLIRGMALRVMSGIRVPMISPIVVLGIKKCVTDMSPYVRKIAAHAIPKCYQLDPAQKDALIDIISTMLGDNSTFTIGSVLMAFNQVCPDRLDLIHPVYRKLCKMLIDMDEWGQIIAIDLLLRYARTQFLNPIGAWSTPRAKKEKSVVRAFYSDDDSDVSHHTYGTMDSSDEDEVNEVDPDLYFLIKCALPLLQSRNSQVVLSVAKMYMHLAPVEESYKLGRPLVRQLRGHREIQYVVLNNIVAIASQRPQVFDQYYQHFYVRSTDPVFIRNLKLEILTMIVTDSNITFILRELQEYVKSSDKEFVAQAIEAIGRCAYNIPAMADSCLSGLLKLAYSTSDSVVSESVVAIRRLLQQYSAGENISMITQLTKALGQITEPLARANIFWLVGQYCHQLPMIAPDVLRTAAKSFCSESDIGKLQILTLGGKLVAQDGVDSVGTVSKTINLLFQYVLNVARYDLNYDVRDRARFLRALVYDGSNNVHAASSTSTPPVSTKNGVELSLGTSLPTNGLDSLGLERSLTSLSLRSHASAEGNGDHPSLGNHEAGSGENGDEEAEEDNGFAYTDKPLKLSNHVKKILLSDKEPPVQENPSHGREAYRIGSLSLVMNRHVAGYEPLPDWPTEQPDPSVRKAAASMETLPGHMSDRTGFGSESFGRMGSGIGSPSSVSSARYDNKSGSGHGSSSAVQSLDKFLETTSEEETSSEEEEDSSDEEEESSGEGSDEESNESSAGSEEESEDNEEGNDDDDDGEETSSEEEVAAPLKPSRKR
ncbi:AP-3 complex subunit beta-2 [Lunasporangiospora selenospora]|uniref:AP-3 complex subunit beta n=1 Tax=Lunasporangiospora selenospora TaxID=979761 RepID=A0A9P6FVC4_9FUNG|nr:AP-3 complex subunit beta-2 [Lunasporangiospora selenospora]